jgi:hypothetical protein
MSISVPPGAFSGARFLALKFIFEQAATMKPKITYFAVRGRAEAIRLMLEDLGIEYDERRISVGEWPSVKATLMFGELPTYGEGEIFIDQSHAIYR